jgi:hypothetical protein
MEFHSCYVGLDGADYFVTVYARRGEVAFPLLTVDKLTEEEAAEFARTFEFGEVAIGLA